jgi:hypothetical protein
VTRHAASYAGFKSAMMIFFMASIACIAALAFA